MPQTIQRSFTSGELAPALQSRADLSKYASGLNLCENFIVRSQGGVYSRGGLRYIHELTNGGGRLIPFEYSADLSYVLAFEAYTATVILNGAVVATFAHGYSADELADIRYAQDAATMTFVHPNHQPANLYSVNNNLTWYLQDINYGSNIYPPSIASLTVTGSGGGDYLKTYRYVVTAVDGTGEESVASAESSLNTNSLTSTYGIELELVSTGGEYYRVYKDPSDGSGIYGWIGDTKEDDNGRITFTDFNLAPITSDAPPEARDPFSDSVGGTGFNSDGSLIGGILTNDNKPSCVTYYQQRQVFAATNNEPQAVFTTQTNRYRSMRTSNPARDDDAVTFTIAANQVNEIRHLLSLDSLVILTSGGEWVTTEGGDNVLTPSSIGVRIQSYNGCSNVPPVVINSTALYVQAKGAKLRDLGYQFNSDKYTGTDLSLLAEHLFDGYQITDMAYSAEPYGIVWCVRDDGVLLGLTYQREHEVLAWHHHTTDGGFESVTSISESGRDAVYLIVKRTVNGVERQFVERMEPRETRNAEDAFCVDCGLSYDGVAVSTVTGLDHLIGEEVAILADGNVVPNQVVDANGHLTLPVPASKVHAGLPYTPVLETLDLDTIGAETLKSNSVSVAKVTLECEATRGGWVGARNDVGADIDMMEVKPRFDYNNYDTLALRTFKQEVFVPPQWSKGGGLRIEQRSPLPMAVLSVIPQVDVGGN